MKCSGNGIALPIVAGCGFCITEKFSWLKNSTAQFQHESGDKRYFKRVLKIFFRVLKKS
jgi:hypothetical protein